MSHTFQHEKVSFIHNGDMSGDVTIVRTDTGQRIDIPCEAVLEFVADYICREKICRLENCTTNDLLFGDMP